MRAGQAGRTRSDDCNLAPCSRALALRIPQPRIHPPKVEIRRLDPVSFADKSLEGAYGDRRIQRAPPASAQLDDCERSVTRYAVGGMPVYRLNTLLNWGMDPKPEA